MQRHDVDVNELCVLRRNALYQAISGRHYRCVMALLERDDLDISCTGIRMWPESSISWLAASQGDVRVLEALSSRRNFELGHGALCCSGTILGAAVDSQSLECTEWILRQFGHRPIPKGYRVSESALARLLHHGSERSYDLAETLLAANAVCSNHSH
jgi:hypothetical protein